MIAYYMIIAYNNYCLLHDYVNIIIDNDSTRIIILCISHNINIINK